MKLGNLKIGARLAMVVLAGIIGTIVVAAVQMHSIRENLIQDRMVQIRTLVQSAQAVFERYEKFVKEGTLDRTEAQARAKTAIESMIYEGGGYFFVYDEKGTTVSLITKPELVGKNLMGMKDPNGKPFVREFIEESIKNGDHFVDYLWPKPGKEAPVPKLSYTKYFKPWGWVIGTGIYIDDVRCDLSRKPDFYPSESFLPCWRSSASDRSRSAAPLPGLSIRWPATCCASPMGTSRSRSRTRKKTNEIGDLSRAMQTFLNKTIEMDEMRAAQEAAEKRGRGREARDDGLDGRRLRGLHRSGGQPGILGGDRTAQFSRIDGSDRRRHGEPVGDGFRRFRDDQQQRPDRGRGDRGAVVLDRRDRQPGGPSVQRGGRRGAAGQRDQRQDPGSGSGPPTRSARWST